jgi:hypothetical protein
MSPTSNCEYNQMLLHESASNASGIGMDAVMSRRGSRLIFFLLDPRSGQLTEFDSHKWLSADIRTRLTC